MLETTSPWERQANVYNYIYAMSVSGNDAQASNDADDGGSSDALSAAECGPEGAAAEALLSEFPADDEYADQVRRFMLLCMTSALLHSS